MMCGVIDGGEVSGVSTWPRHVAGHLFAGDIVRRRRLLRRRYRYLATYIFVRNTD